MPGITGPVQANLYTGYSETRDIAWLDNNIVWVASDWSSVTLRAYNSSGTWTDYITADLVPSATGVAIDPDGYLWVSDMDNDKLYKIDLETSLDRSTWGDIKTEF